MFADPFSTAGLVIDPKMHKGFDFEVHDLMEHKKVVFHCPEEMYDLLVFIGAPGRYCVKSVYSRTLGEIAATSSTQRLNLMAGRYVGKDDLVMIVRCQSGMPAVGEALGAFLQTSHCRRVDERFSPRSSYALQRGAGHSHQVRRTSRVMALGFQICQGKLVGPQDFFADVAFDRARQIANEVSDYLRAMGPFEPHRLGLEELEYTTMPEVMKKLAGRMEPIE